MLKARTQIAYIPPHADGDINHPDVEFGFITSVNHALHFHMCRYWRKGEPGVLRTTANSELTPEACLVEHESVPQERVDNWFGRWIAEE